MELPTGDLIPESDILMQYAMESAPAGQGIDLIPSDPIEAAEMRLRMANFGKNWFQYFGPVSMSRFQDFEAIEKFVQECLP